MVYNSELKIGALYRNLRFFKELKYEKINSIVSPSSFNKFCKDLWVTMTQKHIQLEIWNKKLSETTIFW